MEYNIVAKASGKYDVIVCGGGTAGVAAAIAAARAGSKTLLLERTFTVGGMLTWATRGSPNFLSIAGTLRSTRRKCWMCWAQIRAACKWRAAFRMNMLCA